MNYKKKALGGFTKTKDAALVVKSYTILKGLEESRYFPDPQPSLALLREHAKAFEQQLSRSLETRSLQDTTLKNDRRQVLVDTLQKLAYYVSVTANGTLEQLQSSGFSISKDIQRNNVPEKVRDLVLRDGYNSGQIRLSFGKQPRVPLYEYRYRRLLEDQEPDDWSELMITSSSRNNIISSLQPVQRYEVQVRALNGYGRSEWSDAAPYIVR